MTDSRLKPETVRLARQLLEGGTDNFKLEDVVLELAEFVIGADAIMPGPRERELRARRFDVIAYQAAAEAAAWRGSGSSRAFDTSDVHEVKCETLIEAVHRRIAQTEQPLKPEVILPKRPCRAVWRAGVLAPPGFTIPDGTRCELDEHGPDVEHSFGGVKPSDVENFYTRAAAVGRETYDRMVNEPKRSAASFTRCSVPMCGESGLCDDCRARGAR